MSLSMESDAPKLGIGFLLMLVYTATMLGRMNRVENRFILSAVGVFGIIFGAVASLGLSSLLGFPYTTLHAIVIYLVLGIRILNEI